MPNTHPETGIHFGHLPASHLHPRDLDRIAAFGIDLQFEHWRSENPGADPDDYSNDAGTLEYETEDVKLTLFPDGDLLVRESRWIAECAPCSPCVPGAGDLTCEGSLPTYAVPPDWLEAHSVSIGPIEKRFPELRHELGVLPFDPVEDRRIHIDELVAFLLETGKVDEDETIRLVDIDVALQQLKKRV